MPFLNTILSLYDQSRINEIEKFKTHPQEVQKEVLDFLISTAKNTEWGEKYNYSALKSVIDFQRSVPIQNYEEIKPWVERLREGEKNVLWPGSVKWFAKSSGTTSDKSKFIPVTKEALDQCHFRGGKDVLLLYRNIYKESNLFKGKTLTLGGSTQINSYDNKSFYGDLSAILISNAPAWTEFVRVPKAKFALIEDFEEKIRKIVESAVHENIVSLAGVPSWNLVLLREVLRYTGKTNILEVWPNLELFIHGGVSFSPYLSEYKSIIPSDQMHYMETYNASEGFFAIQDDPESRDMLLMLDYGVFYEFIPLKELENTSFIPLTIAEVEKGIPYAMLISTNGGLWRYMIGDVVEFTSLLPHKIVISGRTKQYINVFGEELMVHNALDALKVACDATESAISDFTIAPIFMNEQKQGAHQWLIEFTQMPASIDDFSKVLDLELQSLNSDYEAKRYKDSVLTKPEVVIARPGLFFEWMKERGKLGGQNKIPSLSNDREHMEALLQLNKL